MSATRRRLRFVGIYAACAVLLFWALAPIYWVLVSSISTRIELYAAPAQGVVPDASPTFEHYQVLLSGGGTYRGGIGCSAAADLLWSGLTNSFVSSVSTALIVTILCTGAGYVFARMRFRGKQVSLLLHHADDAAADLGGDHLALLHHVAGRPRQYPAGPDASSSSRSRSRSRRGSWRRSCATSPSRSRTPGSWTAPHAGSSCAISCSRSRGPG